jgi:imidazolonepropionase-like amidohydrolase
MSDVSPHLGTKSIRSFNDDELSAMISTAHASGVKVAVHTQTNAAVSSLLYLDVDSIEHAPDMHSDPDLLAEFAECSRTTWVPTLSIFYKMQDSAPAWKSQWTAVSTSFKRALELGMENIACGGDIGGVAHGENALEMKLMVRLGAPYLKVLKWATLGGWECIRGMDWEKMRDVPREQLGDNEVWFGAVKPGWAADLVGLEGDIAGDFEGTVDRVSFVMKAGKVYKEDGKDVSP